jgi:hypothetical protein
MRALATIATIASRPAAAPLARPSALLAGSAVVLKTTAALAEIESGGAPPSDAVGEVDPTEWREAVGGTTKEKNKTDGRIAMELIIRPD